MAKTMSFLKKAAVLLAFILAANALGINRWAARYSVVASVILTIYPFPFLIEASYSSGYVSGVSVGDPEGVAIAIMNENKYCESKVRWDMIKNDAISSDKVKEVAVVFRCVRGGMAWNHIMVFEGGILREIRLAGGIWT